MEIIGKQFIDGRRSAESGITFSSCDAATGETLPCTFFICQPAVVVARMTSGAVSILPLFRQKVAILLPVILSGEHVQIVLISG